MSFFSDTKETLARYGSYVAEFQSLCRKHAASCGSPEEFFRLAPKLVSDDQFRDEFSALTKSIAQQEKGRLTLTRMLTIIALAIGGEDIESIGAAGAVPVSLAVVFLAGIGGWAQDQEKISPPQEPMPDNPIAKTNDAQSSPDEIEAIEFERRVSAGLK